MLKPFTLILLLSTYLWLHWVFAAACGLSAVAVFWLLIAMASLIEEHRLWGTRASTVVARRP